MQGSSRFSPARTCPSFRPGQSMTGGPGGTGEHRPLREPGKPPSTLSGLHNLLYSPLVDKGDGSGGPWQQAQQPDFKSTLQGET
ncbi:mCG1051038 [Mus musculus]|nr:mCG1051038 [Mus musculus]